MMLNGEIVHPYCNTDICPSCGCYTMSRICHRCKLCRVCCRCTQRDLQLDVDRVTPAQLAEIKRLLKQFSVAKYGMEPDGFKLVWDYHCGWDLGIRWADIESLPRELADEAIYLLRSLVNEAKEAKHVQTGFGDQSGLSR